VNLGMAMESLELGATDLSPRQALKSCGTHSCFRLLPIPTSSLVQTMFLGCCALISITIFLGLVSGTMSLLKLIVSLYALVILCVLALQATHLVAIFDSLRNHGGRITALVLVSVLASGLDRFVLVSSAISLAFCFAILGFAYLFPDFKETLLQQTLEYKLEATEMLWRRGFDSDTKTSFVYSLEGESAKHLKQSKLSI